MFAPPLLQGSLLRNGPIPADLTHCYQRREWQCRSAKRICCGLEVFAGKGADDGVPAKMYARMRTHS
jgi:hypothetical protein